MKTNKSVEKVELTPSKKKLTQARLPFKLISEDASTPVAPPTRKRKLSADGTDSAVKVGKISKENDLIDDDLVVISDEDSKDTSKPEKEVKRMNPFVKLVDAARKKKLQKNKSPKKRKSRRNSSKKSESADENKSQTDEAGDVEMMDVDSENQEQKKETSSNDNMVTKNNTTENKGSEVSDILVLEDSNDSTSVNKPTDKENSKHISSEDKEIDNTNKSDPETVKSTNRKSKSNTENKKNESKAEDKVDKPNDDTMSPTTPTIKAKSDQSKDVDESKSGETVDKPMAEPLTPKTPARRAKSNAKDKLNTSATSIKLNESVSSSPLTPKRESRSSSVTSTLNDSKTESNTSTTNLTPKQLQKKMESAKKKEEREKERLEREKKRQEEKEERNKQRLEKEDAKKREREEREEQKRKEREEKEKQREMEKKLREEKEELKKKEREDKEEQRRKEKEEKEEQRRKEKEAREEEKRKKQEALEQEKQEQELKKKKAAEAFVNFFVPKQKEKDQPIAGPLSQNNILSSFTIKVDMRLAPLVRGKLSDKQKLDMEGLMKQQKVSEKDLYLKNLKKEGTQIGASGKTWPLTDKDAENDDDVMIVEDELPPIDGADEVITCESAVREKLRPKLFSFHENKRPPYWGTWRKKSEVVKPRRPFGQEKQLDYEVDSDEDWEEEQEGESLGGSAPGSDDEPDDEYEVDNELFVPHGYLSDEEATMNEDDVLSLSPETQKARLKNLEEEFESEMKKPTEKLKPRLYGLLWETKDCGKPEKCVDALWNYFGKLSMIMDDPTSLLQPPNEPQEPEKKKVKKKKTPTEGEQPSPKVDKKKKAKPENKEAKKQKTDKQPELKKNQPGINSFLTKLQSP